MFGCEISTSKGSKSSQPGGMIQIWILQDVGVAKLVQLHVEKRDGGSRQEFGRSLRVAMHGEMGNPASGNRRGGRPPKEVERTERVRAGWR